MNLEIYGMMGAGVVALVAGLPLVRARFRAASGADRALVLGPVFEAVALAVFAAEHFLAARDLKPSCRDGCRAPCSGPTSFGAALLAAATSFTAWRYVRWSAPLLGLLFLIIVATIDLPNLPVHADERFFWTLTARELAFAGGAMVLAGSVWPPRSLASIALRRLGRGIVATTLVFYGIQHFLFPQFAPGVPLEKLTRRGCRFRRYLRMSSESFWCSRDWALCPSNDPYCSRLLRDHASAAHGIFLRTHLRTGNPHRARGGRTQLRWRHVAIRGDCSAGRLRRGRSAGLSGHYKPRTSQVPAVILIGDRRKLLSHVPSPCSGMRTCS